mgnify:FL=1
MSLYQKYRPKDFDEFVGNEEVVEALKGLLSKEEKPHVFLFQGETGCGKTTLARIVAKKLGCSNEDIHELNMADFRGIDTIREIIRQMQYLPLSGNCQVWIFDECQKLTNEAQSALLKALEDTPDYVYFILCTTEPDKLLPTIRGRCSQFQVRLLNDDEMMRLLRYVVKAENESLPKAVFEQIIQDSLGHPRNALQILEQVLSVPQDKRMEVAKRTAEQQSQVIELCRALINKDSWKKVANILSGLKDNDVEAIRRMVLGYCQAILLKGENDQAGIVMEQFVNPFWGSFPKLVFACYFIIKG